MANDRAHFLIHETLALAIDKNKVMPCGIGNVADDGVGAHGSNAGAGTRIAVHMPKVSANLLGHFHAIAHIVGGTEEERLGTTHRCHIVLHHLGIAGKTTACHHYALARLDCATVLGQNTVDFLRLIVMHKLYGP